MRLPMFVLAALSFAPLAGGGVSHAASPPSGTLLERQVRLEDGTHRYSVWLPPGFDRSRAWPAILFLHGSGESGGDGLAPTRVGLGPALRARAADWPCVVVFAQKPSEQQEWWEWEALALAELDSAAAEFPLDADRTALVGMSQGGHGAWLLAARHPDRWSALVSICGYGRARTVARRVAHLPVWAFHGLRDDVVDPAETRHITDAIREEKARLGLDPDGLRVTFYPDANHGSWDRAFAEPDLPRWILSQSRTGSGGRSGR
jgi:predicted peptidase